MPRSRVPTVEQRPALGVLVIGGPAPLVRATQHALEHVAPAIVTTCDVIQAATVAAEQRPVAMVINESLHVFDAEEFAALARDIGSSLVVISAEGRDELSMSKELTYLLFEAFQKRSMK